jgi:intron-binding protein aquarius
MPRAKRLKKGDSPQTPASTHQTPKDSLESERPTIADIRGGNAFAEVAQKHWLKPSKKTTRARVKNDVLKKDIWDVLEGDNFSHKSILVLENLQLLERLVQSSKICLFSADMPNFQLPLAWLFRRLL